MHTLPVSRYFSSGAAYPLLACWSARRRSMSSGGADAVSSGGSRMVSHGATDRVVATAAGGSTGARRRKAMGIMEHGCPTAT